MAGVSVLRPVLGAEERDKPTEILSWRCQRVSNSLECKALD